MAVSDDERRAVRGRAIQKELEFLDGLEDWRVAEVRLVAWMARFFLKKGMGGASADCLRWGLRVAETMHANLLPRSVHASFSCFQPHWLKDMERVKQSLDACEMMLEVADGNSRKRPT